ncbi:MAG: AAC(3) family N-acetyltransferase [Clostridiaceae bacterium]|nr:AAC(3) family N-acetyltransferase [Clostridiaceae bacterium]
MNSLNELLHGVPQKDAIRYLHFPTMHQAVIFRNWETVPPSRLAQVLGTDEDTILKAAQDMGLRNPPVIDERWSERGYITMIRNNWHLMPVSQLLELLGWSEEQLAYTLKEDDFLWIKLGKLKPAVEKVAYRPLVYKERDRTKRLKTILKEYFPCESTWTPFGFLDEFSRSLVLNRIPYDAPQPGEFALDESWHIRYEPSFFLDGVVQRFKKHFEQMFGLALNGNEKSIFLKVVPDPNKLAESHILRISAQGIEIDAVDEQGLMRGLQWLEDTAVHRSAPFFVPQQITRTTRFDLRMLYPYSAVYGDPFIDPAADPLPEGLLERLSRTGINGIWLQAVLYKMTPFPFDPSISEGWQERIAGLNRLIEKAGKYGISLYLYINEPRAMPVSFFEKHPQLAGSTDGTHTCLCTSKKAVQDYLRDACSQLFIHAPDLAGVLTITMSENKTNCYSHGGNNCPVCDKRKPYEVIGEVNRCIEEGVHRISPKAKVICWSWAWKQINGWKNEDVPDAVDCLPAGARLMCTSESEMPYTIGGVNGIVADYTMSIPGPGDRAKLFWSQAHRRGMPVMAKVQLNNTWECAAVPFLPVIDLVREHLDNLYNCGVTALMVSWTLGGYPSSNLELASQYYWEQSPVSHSVESTGIVDRAQTIFSEAFREFPFHVGVLYNGPQNYGPMNLLLPRPSGYQATMIGFPYDDLEGWRSIYPEKVFHDQFEKLCEKWEKGIALLETATHDPQIEALAVVAKALLYHFKSTLLQIRYVRLRNGVPPVTDIQAFNSYIKTSDLRDVIMQERDLAVALWRLMNQDSRIGFEASNHYFYTEGSLKEKVLNCQYLLDHVFVSIITRSDIELSLKNIGIDPGDIVLVHSSLSSLGKVENGAQTVIDAFEAVLGLEGTLVFPTLCQEDFTHSYETWHLDKASDVGYLTEYFRKLPRVYRSNQATHSVAALGKYAQELTYEHTAYGLRYGIFGDTPFSRSSPWQKMYDMNGKVVFIGVSMLKNTFKHLMEYRVVDEALARIPEGQAKSELKDRIWDFDHYENHEGKIWPFHNGEQLQAALEKAGLIKKISCGKAELICVGIREMVDNGLRWFKEDPGAWYPPDVLAWLRDAEEAAVTE